MRWPRTQPASIRLEIDGASPDRRRDRRALDPRDRSARDSAAAADRARASLPSSSRTSLATTLARKASGRVDGFVVEGPTAGGHNAPPRGRRCGSTTPASRSTASATSSTSRRSASSACRSGWPAATARPSGSRAALAAGAAGIQVGTALRLRRGVRPRGPSYKRTVLMQAARGTVEVRTDPLASPTGFPFKVARSPGDPAATRRLAARPRVCDLGYLRTPYQRPDGRSGYRCPAEPVQRMSTRAAGWRTPWAAGACATGSWQTSATRRCGRTDGWNRPC